MVEATAFAVGTGGASPSTSGVGSGNGVSSTVECFPVVHGGIERNSSKVRTRGLQHFQPGQEVLVTTKKFDGVRKGRADTFLPFMEDGRSRMVKTVLLQIRECFATALVNALLGHFDRQVAWLALQNTLEGFLCF